MTIAVRPALDEARVVVAEEAHCGDLAPRLRASDVRELAAQIGQSPLDGLTSSFRLSTRRHSVVDGAGRVLAMFGVVPSPYKPWAGRVWFLACDEMNGLRGRWARESRQWLETIAVDHEMLFNAMDDRNRVARRWVEWLGFDFLWLDQDFGPERRPFWFFCRFRDAEAAAKHAETVERIRRVGPWD